MTDEDPPGVGLERWRTDVYTKTHADSHHVAFGQGEAGRIIEDLVDDDVGDGVAKCDVAGDGLDALDGDQ